MTPQDSSVARQLFEHNMGLIHRLIRHLGCRHRLRWDELEDLSSYVMLRLIDDNFAVFRNFKGSSTLKTYLTTVVCRLMIDYRHQEWGKWRPCAQARKMGPVAIRLDRLLHRDGYDLDEAVNHLQNNFKVALSRGDLYEIAGNLPPRVSRRAETGQELSQLAVVEELAEERLYDGERSRIARKAEAVLQKALGGLAAEDRLLLKMRFEDAMTARQIAKALQIKQRRVYTRISQCLKQLRAVVDHENLSRGEAAELLSWQGSDMRIAFEGYEAGSRSWT